MQRPDRNMVIIYALVFIVVSSVTFFWLDKRDHDMNVYRHDPMSRETQIITEQYKIKRLEDRIKDMRSGAYKQRLQGLSREGLPVSDAMIQEEISTAEVELRQARKRLDHLLSK